MKPHVRNVLNSRVFCVCLCLGIGLVARVAYLWKPALEIDGLQYCAIWSRYRLGFLMFSVTLGDTHPPLQFLISWLARALLGESEWALSLPSVLFGVGAMFLLWRWAVQTHRGVAGLAALGLMTLSVYHVYWSQHPRMYSLLMFCSIGLLWKAEKLSSASNPKDFVLFSAFFFGTLGAHFFGVMSAFVVFVLIVFRWIGSCRNDPPEVCRRFTIRLFYAFMVPVVLLLPWYLHFLMGLLGAGANFGQLRVKGAPLQMDAAFVKMVAGVYGFGSSWLLYVFLALVALGIGWQVRRRRWTLLGFEASWFLLPYAVLAVVPVPHFYDPSYTCGTAPILWLWAGGGIAILAGLLGRAIPCFKTPIGLTCAGLAVSLAVFSYPLSLLYQLGGRPVAVKEILHRIEQQAAEGQVIVIEDPYDIRFFSGYYEPQKRIYFVHLGSMGVPGGRKADLLAYLQTRPDAWLLQGNKIIEPVNWADSLFSNKVVFDNEAHAKLYKMGLFPRPVSAPNPWVLHTDYLGATGKVSR